MKMQVSTATTAELIAFFNANTGGAPVKKFADRKTAERRVQALITEMVEDGDMPETIVLSNNDQHADEVDPADARLIREYGTAVCPHCGIDLCNGVGEHLQEVNGSYIKHDKFQWACLGCGEEFGPAIPAKKATVSTGKLRPAMVESLKLDRQIVEVTTGAVYKNACQVWKAGLVSAAQGDRLSAVLYGEAKKGNRLMSVTINGHVFALAVK